MEYTKLLRLALVPSIVFLLVSLVSVALTVHYWIIGDWILTKGAKVPTTDFDQKLQQYKTDSSIIWYQDNDTDVTIVSGCLNLTAAVVALIAWSTLRKPGMDSQHAAGRRRFWILAVVAMTITGAATALASIVLHYTEKGNDQYGCTSETLMIGGGYDTNLYCTREMAACHFLPKFVTGADKSNAALACNENMVVKWLQIVLIINALIVFALFGIQARLRRGIRETSTEKPEPEVL